VVLSHYTSYGRREMMEDLVKFIAEALVDHPEEVRVKSIEGANSIIIELKVAKDDVGKVIGKGGQTAKAIRKILSAAATKLKKKSLLQILEE
jgi:predicted RNA-binding protein YlqC (UPF0109 family)